MSDIFNEIRSVALKYDNIDRIVLFGSRARGDNGAKSDIDLAVYGNGDLRGFLSDIENDVHTLLEFDITIMNGELDELFVKQIEKEGVIVYEKS